MWTIAVTLLILSPIIVKLLGIRSKKFDRKWKNFKLSISTCFKFVFRLKSDERLDAFRKIHSLFPRFLHIDFLGLKVLLAYDPEIAKR